MSNEWIKYKEKIVLGDNNTVLCILHLDEVLVFGLAVIDELDVEYFNLSHEEKVNKCYEIALSRAKDNFLQIIRVIDKTFITEQIECQNLYINYLLNMFSDYTVGIIKML